MTLSQREEARIGQYWYMKARQYAAEGDRELADDCLMNAHGHFRNAAMTDAELLASYAIHSDYETNGPRAHHQA